MSSTALVIIDVQNDFVDRIGGTAEALPAMAQVLALFRKSGAPIIHVIRLYEPDGSNAEPLRRPLIQGQGPLVAPGSHGAAIPDALSVKAAPDAALLYSGALQSVGPNEWILYKPRWDAFHQTGLEAHLRGLSVETLVVCGCNLPNCPRATLFGASNRDFRTVLVRDATSQVTEGRLDDLALMGTQVLTAAEIPALLRG